MSETVNITAGLVGVTVETPCGPVEVARVRDTENRLEGEWARTSRPAPPAVLQPLVPVPGVVPLGELELIEMLQRADVTTLDSRKSEQYQKYTIPGASNLPFTGIDDNLDRLGCQRTEVGWECSGAHTIAIFCNGVWCGQSPAAIRKMVAVGYPPERIHYYRNGLQGWLLQGLSVWTPGTAQSFHL